MFQAFIRISLEIRTPCSEDWKFDAPEFHSALLSPFPIHSWLTNWSLSVFVILKRDIIVISQRHEEAYFSVYQSAFKMIWAKEYYDLGNWYGCKKWLLGTAVKPGQVSCGDIIPTVREIHPVDSLSHSKDRASFLGLFWQWHLHVFSVVSSLNSLFE